ncbi:hypothetical protein PR048_022112 [Dryococelus australis]|uniref:Uncharacterized protein n=1 Tax=Dryococelus australis TaxID=614101 RepID=A0ABQ9H087_9NEOP|nr:hypothetical protein PR048_022112 [Dryococelus australis]
MPVSTTAGLYLQLGACRVYGQMRTHQHGIMCMPACVVSSCEVPCVMQTNAAMTFHSNVIQPAAHKLYVTYYELEQGLIAGGATPGFYSRVANVVRWPTGFLWVTPAILAVASRHLYSFASLRHHHRATRVWENLGWNPGFGLPRFPEIIPGRRSIKILCTLEPQLCVHWLLSQRVASVTPHLAVRPLTLVSLQVCYRLRVVLGVSNELLPNCKGPRRMLGYLLTTGHGRILLHVCFSEKLDPSAMNSLSTRPQPVATIPAKKATGELAKLNNHNSEQEWGENGDQPRSQCRSGQIVRGARLGEFLTNARLHHRGSKLDPRSDLRVTQKTVAPFEFRAGLEIEMKFISNHRNCQFVISIRDQQPSSTNSGDVRLAGSAWGSDKTCGKNNERAYAGHARLPTPQAAYLATSREDDQGRLTTTALIPPRGGEPRGGESPGGGRAPGGESPGGGSAPGGECPGGESPGGGGGAPGGGGGEPGGESPGGERGVTMGGGGASPFPSARVKIDSPCISCVVHSRRCKRNSIREATRIQGETTDSEPRQRRLEEGSDCSSDDEDARWRDEGCVENRRSRDCTMSGLRQQHQHEPTTGQGKRPRWCNDYTSRLTPRRTGFESRRGRSWFSAREEFERTIPLISGFSRAGFLRGLPLPLPLLSGAAACSRRRRERDERREWREKKIPGESGIMETMKDAVKGRMEEWEIDEPTKKKKRIFWRRGLLDYCVEVLNSITFVKIRCFGRAAVGKNKVRTHSTGVDYTRDHHSRTCNDVKRAVPATPPPFSHSLSLFLYVASSKGSKNRCRAHSRRLCYREEKCTETKWRDSSFDVISYQFSAWLREALGMGLTSDSLLHTVKGSLLAGMPAGTVSRAYREFMESGKTTSDARDNCLGVQHIYDRVRRRLSRFVAADSQAVNAIILCRQHPAGNLHPQQDIAQVRSSRIVTGRFDERSTDLSLVLGARGIQDASAGEYPNRFKKVNPRKCSFTTGRMDQNWGIEKLRICVTRKGLRQTGVRLVAYYSRVLYHVIVEITYLSNAELYENIACRKVGCEETPLSMSDHEIFTELLAMGKSVLECFAHSGDAALDARATVALSDRSLLCHVASAEVISGAADVRASFLSLGDDDACRVSALLYYVQVLSIHGKVAVPTALRTRITVLRVLQYLNNQTAVRTKKRVRCSASAKPAFDIGIVFSHDYTRNDASIPPYRWQLKSCGPHNYAFCNCTRVIADGTPCHNTWCPGRMAFTNQCRIVALPLRPQTLLRPSSALRLKLDSSENAMRLSNVDVPRAIDDVPHEAEGSKWKLRRRLHDFSCVWQDQYLLYVTYYLHIPTPAHIVSDAKMNGYTTSRPSCAAQYKHKTPCRWLWVAIFFVITMTEHADLSLNTQMSVPLQPVAPATGNGPRHRKQLVLKESRADKKNFDGSCLFWNAPAVRALFVARWTRVYTLVFALRWLCNAVYNASIVTFPPEGRWFDVQSRYLQMAALNLNDDSACSYWIMFTLWWSASNDEVWELEKKGGGGGMFTRRRLEKGRVWSWLSEEVGRIFMTSAVHIEASVPNTMSVFPVDILI